MATDMTVANTILAQMGGGRFKMMTGAHSFASNGKNLIFGIKARAKKGIKSVEIALEDNDTYTVFFRNRKYENVSKIENVYCDMLQELFTNETGLYTSL